MAETSASELLDVVDFNDIVVDSKSRGEVHRLQLPHRSIHVLVFNANGDLLLQKRSMQKDECAGMWGSSCAGHVEAGQHYATTVVREFEEELGIEPGCVPEYLFKMSPTADNGMEFAADTGFITRGRLCSQKMRLTNWSGSLTRNSIAGLRVTVYWTVLN